ncbi:galactokinase [Caviibacter abscessus]|uniref:galactokinase n=1 Tax=Caviibacter abscessus TaxID=1766719 RepID=UPI000829B8CB|nr:galactokinase family protein [Caviibacter abscessus]
MKYIDKILKLYKNENNCIKRYENLLYEYKKQFGNTDDYELFSSSGRTEIIGNHTDHNHGKVVCASINLDTIAIACKNNDNKIRIKSLEYNENYVIDLNNLDVEKNNSWSCILVKGMLNALKKSGNIGGFNACITSTVISSAGVSSSASFEMLIGTIINSFYNNDKLDIVTLAKAGQYSENTNWNKKSGLLDQIACANGGLVSIDFEDIKNPKITKLSSSDIEHKYDIIIVPTGGTHADLSEEYSAIPNEMISIANTELRNINKQFLLENINVLRKKCGDRAILRAMHFFDENERVDNLILALNEKNYSQFLKIIQNSGLSSYKYLQNCYVPTKSQEQPIPIILALTQDYIEKYNIKGTCRVHGGGFAGVIMTILPKEDSNSYIKYILKYVNGDVYKVNIRSYGAINLKNI